MNDAWTIASAVGGVLAAMAAVLTLAYMVAKDRKEQAPVFQLCLGKAAMPHRLRVTMRILRDAPLPEWRLIEVKVVQPTGGRLMSDDDVAHDRSGAPSQSIGLIANSEKVLSWQAWLQCRTERDFPRKVELELTLRRATGARRRIKVRSFVTAVASARAF